MSLAPIVLFVYNRLGHTQQTVAALRENELAVESELYIFADGVKPNSTKKQRDKVAAVREYINSLAGFKKITVRERRENWGLAKNIIAGVGEIVAHYGKVIVLEDDIVTSPAFLSYMNQALDFYEKEKRVWHVAGWTPLLPRQSAADACFIPEMHCWGWGTWGDRWQHFAKDPAALIAEFTPEMIRQFNISGNGRMWQQVLLNQRGRLSTWAVFWGATIFKRDGLCLSPMISYANNIGCDDSGVHCSRQLVNKYEKQRPPLSLKREIVFPAEITADPQAFEALRLWHRYHSNFWRRVVNKLLQIARF